MSRRKEWHPNYWTTWYEETQECIKTLIISKFRRMNARTSNATISMVFFRIDVKNSFEYRLDDCEIEKKSIESGFTNALNDMVNKEIVNRHKGRYEVNYGSNLYYEIIEAIIKILQNE